MATIGTAFIDVKPDLSGFGTSLNTQVAAASSGADDASRAAGSRSGSFFGQAWGIAMKAGVAAIGIGAAAQIGMQFIDAGSDMQESLSKVTVVFGDNAGAIKDWASTAATSMGQSRTEALEAAGTLGNLFTSMGMGTGPAAEMSTSLVELSSDLASFNNVPVEDAMTALRAGLVGETEPLRRFGVNLNEASIQAEAMRLGIAGQGDVLTAAQKAQAAYSLIMQQSTNAQGDFQRTSEGAANQQKILSAQVEDAKARIGSALLPAFQGVIQFLTSEALPAFEDFIGLLRDSWPEIQAAIAPAFEQIGQIIGDAVALWSEIWTKWGDDITRIAQFVWDNVLLRIQSALNIIQGIIKTVTALIQGDWSGVWEGIKQIVEGVWQGILAVIQTAVFAIGTILSALWNIVTSAFRAAWDGALNLVQSGWSAILGLITSIPGAVMSALAALPGVLLSIFTGALNAARSAVSAGLSGIASAFSALPGLIMGWAGAVGQAAVAIGAAIINGVKSGVTGAWGFASDVASALVNALKTAWNSFARTVNDLIPNSLGWGPASIDLPDSPIPTFATGGLVPGRRGAPLLAIVHGGEYVVPVGGAPSGMAAVAIQEATFVSPADFDALLNRVNLALAAGRL